MNDVMSYQMQLHLAHKERLARLQKSVKKQENKKFAHTRLRNVKLTCPSIKFVMGHIARYYELPTRTLITSRSLQVHSYRSLGLYFCKRILNYSFRKIASMLKLDRKSVYVGVKRFEELLLTDPTLALDLRAIRMKVNNAFSR